MVISPLQGSVLFARPGTQGCALGLVMRALRARRRVNFYTACPQSRQTVARSDQRSRFPGGLVVSSVKGKRHHLQPARVAANPGCTPGVPLRAKRRGVFVRRQAQARRQFVRPRLRPSAGSRRVMAEDNTRGPVATARRRRERTRATTAGWRGRERHESGRTTTSMLGKGRLLRDSARGPRRARGGRFEFASQPEVKVVDLRRRPRQRRFRDRVSD